MSSFYELSVKDALALIEENNVEYLANDKWHPCFDVVIKGYMTYRIKPMKESLKPSIDWDQVHPSFKYLTKDLDGSCFLHKTEPKIMEGTSIWMSEGDYYYSANTHISLCVGSCDWKDSLVSRN